MSCKQLLLQFAQIWQIRSWMQRLGAPICIMPNLTKIGKIVAETPRFNGFPKRRPAAVLDFQEVNKPTDGAPPIVFWCILGINFCTVLIA